MYGKSIVLVLATILYKNVQKATVHLLLTWNKILSPSALIEKEPFWHFRSSEKLIQTLTIKKPFFWNYIEIEQNLSKAIFLLHFWVNCGVLAWEKKISYCVSLNSGVVCFCSSYSLWALPNVLQKARHQSFIKDVSPHVAWSEKERFMYHIFSSCLFYSFYLSSNKFGLRRCL